MRWCLGTAPLVDVVTIEVGYPILFAMSDEETECVGNITPVPRAGKNDGLLSN